MNHQLLTRKTSSRSILVGRGVVNNAMRRPTTNGAKNGDVGKNLHIPLHSTELSLTSCVPPHNEGVVDRKAEKPANLQPPHSVDVKMPIKAEEEIRRSSFGDLKLHNPKKEATVCCTAAEQGGGGTDSKVIAITKDAWDGILQRLNTLEAAAHKLKADVNGRGTPKETSCLPIAGNLPETEDNHLNNKSNIGLFVNRDSRTRIKSSSFTNASVCGPLPRSSSPSSSMTEYVAVSRADSSSFDGGTGEDDGPVRERLDVLHIRKSPGLRQSFCKGMNLSSVSLTLTQEIAKVMLQMRRMKKRTKAIDRGLRGEIRKRQVLERHTSHAIRYLFKVIRFFQKSVYPFNLNHSDAKGAVVDEGEVEDWMLTNLNTDEALPTDPPVLPGLHEFRCPSGDPPLSQCVSVKGPVPPFSGIKLVEPDSEYGEAGEVTHGLVPHQYPTVPHPPMTSSSGAKSRMNMVLLPEILDDIKANRSEASQGREDRQREPPTSGESHDTFTRLKQEDSTFLGRNSKVTDESFLPLPMLMDGSSSGMYNELLSSTVATLSSEMGSRPPPRVELSGLQRSGRRNMIVEVPPSVAEEDVAHFQASYHRPDPAPEPPVGDPKAAGGRRAPVRVSCPLLFPDGEGPGRALGPAKGSGSSAQLTAPWQRQLDLSLPSTKSRGSLERTLASGFALAPPPSNWDRGPLEGSELAAGPRQDEALQSSLDSLDGPPARGDGAEERRGRPAGRPPAFVFNQPLPLPQFTPILGHPPYGGRSGEDAGDGFLTSPNNSTAMSPRSLIRLPKELNPKGLAKYKNRSTPSFPSSLRMAPTPTLRPDRIGSPDKSN